MRVAVAMSGGVDSSVAAALLQEQGADVVGVTFHLWDAPENERVGRCCAPEDRDDARRTCDALGVPHYVLDERDAFRRDVVNPFVAAYAEGRTPAPCVACNQSVKLTRLVEFADAVGATHVATGHYARIERRGDAVALLAARDALKDQSYFLYGAGQRFLARAVFPLGDLTKAESREHGRRLRVPNAEKPDSQELCFVPDGRVAEFIEREGVVAKAGPIVDEAGKKIGEHPGVHHFTIGQRQGLSMLHPSAPETRPRYVLKLVPEDNTIVVGPNDAAFSSKLVAPSARWIGGAPREPFTGHVRIRYRHRGAAARIIPEGDGFRAELEKPERAITRGQAAVVYVGDEVRGGGIIA